IRNNVISLPGEKFSADVAKPGSDGKVTLVLNSSEDLFVELRNLNFTTVGGTLGRVAKQLSKEQGEHRDAKTLSAVKDFVSRLPKILETKKSLSKHCTITELVQEHISQPSFTTSIFCEQEFLRGEAAGDKPHPTIEDSIVNGVPLTQALRLICMHSLTSNGLRPKVLEHYKQEIVHQYGVDKLILLKNLENCGLLRTYQGSQKRYGMMLKTLRLSVDNVGEGEPTEMAFVHQMYAPLSIRLLQFYGSPGWRAITDVLEVLPGPTIEALQAPVCGKLQRRGSRESLQSGVGLEEKKLALVVFIGGCTFAEIAALRWLSQQDDSSMEFIILTTSVINGNSLINSLKH
ncbi:vacuolar protein sorting-associated protein 33A-like, partial [Tropilaelaps mercedesae]